MIWFLVAAGLVVLLGFTAFTGAPYVPSKPGELRRALTELYELTDSDVLVDIGSGDGVVLRATSSLGARAIGYELNPVFWLVSWVLSRRDSRVSARFANFWWAELPADTTIVYTFGDARDIARMATKVQSEATRLAHGLFFISYAFEIPGKKAIKTVGAHHLYKFEALQEEKP